MVRFAARAGSALASAAIGLLMIGVTMLAVANVAPRLLGYDRYVIDGTSMSGTYERGALVIEERAPVTALKVGDVITYLPPPNSGVHHVVTHRISVIKVGKEGRRLFRTKGDANASVDPWIFTLDNPTQTRVVHAVPLVGYPIIFLADPAVRRLAIAVPGAIVALVSLVELALVLRPERRLAPALATD